MRWVERSTIGTAADDMPTSLFRLDQPVVAVLADALEIAGAEQRPITTMRDDVVGDSRSDDQAALFTPAAKRLARELVEPTCLPER